MAPCTPPARSGAALARLAANPPLLLLLLLPECVWDTEMEEGSMAVDRSAWWVHGGWEGQR